jgi:hypothetical protein
MKFICAIVAALVLAAGASHVNAKSWRGIVPLKSTRADVRQRLGDGTIPTDPGGKYILANEEVVILYSNKDGYYDCVKRLPPNLVLQIVVTPKSPLSVDRIGLDNRMVRTVGATTDHPLRSRGLIDDENGSVVSVGMNDAVDKVVYLPTKADRARCPEYYGDLVTFVQEIFCVLCPSFAVASPDDVEAGTPLTFVVGGTSVPNLTYKWTVNEGTITGGQGTSSITVDTSKLAGKTLTATVEIGGIDPACATKASSSTKVVAGRN